MEPIYEFDNKDIKKYRDNISHDCRLIEAQAIDFLLYLDAKVESEIDPVKREKLKNIVSVFETNVDATTKLKSELLESYKTIDSTYTNLKKLGFESLIDEYNNSLSVNNNVVEKEEVNEQVIEAPQVEAAPEEVVQEEEKEEEITPEEEEVEQVVQEDEEVELTPEEIVAQAQAEEAAEEEEVEQVAEEEEKETSDEAVLIPTEEGTEEAVEEPVMVEATEQPSEEAVLIPTEGAVEEAVEEPVLVPNGEEAVEAPVDAPELVIPAIEGGAEAPEVQEEPTVVEEAQPEAVVNPDAEVVPEVPIPVVGEETTPEVADVAVTEGLDKYVKEDNNPTSRILVTEAQYAALKASLPEKEALLSARERTAQTTVNETVTAANDLMPTSEEDIQAKIEQMMEQANQLYQSGDAAGAQALYDQISIENQKLQDQQQVVK